MITAIEARSITNEQTKNWIEQKLETEILNAAKAKRFSCRIQYHLLQFIIAAEAMRVLKKSGYKVSASSRGCRITILIKW